MRTGLHFKRIKNLSLDTLNRFNTILILQIPQFFAICSVFYGWLNICTICLIGVCCWNFFIVIILFCPCNNRKKSSDQRFVWVLMKDTWKNISQDHTVHINSCAKTELSSFWAHFIVKIHHRRDISCENNKLLMIFISFNVLSILCDVLLELGFTRFPFQGIYFCNEFFMYHINSRYHKKSFLSLFECKMCCVSFINTSITI